MTNYYYWRKYYIFVQKYKQKCANFQRTMVLQVDFFLVGVIQIEMIVS